jgi:predicted nuclease of predicted toxin-antitoxin system
MRVLLDSCVWGGAVATLREAGHDVEWTGSWPVDPGDERILEHARATARTLVTLDKDFGELAIVRGLPHFGIVRLVNLSGPQQGAVCVQVLARFAAELQRMAIITVEAGRIRIRVNEA